MPIRNPFAKRTPGLDPDENSRPGTQNGLHPTFEKADTMGSRSSAMSIDSGRSQEPAEYKLSVVNDSGVYLPPSPTEKKSFWGGRTTLSRESSGTRKSLADNEPFSISRESFDSYRRSFDISAKSPVVQHETGRQSLDSARLSRLPRSALNDRTFQRQPPTTEEGFEDVVLNDEQSKPPPTKKKGFFAKFGESGETNAMTGASATSRFHITGRKRGQSGQGAELGNMDRPVTSGSTPEIAEVR